MRFAKQLPIGKTDLRFEVETTRQKKIKEETESKRKLYLGVRVIGLLALLTLGVITWTIFGRNFTPPEISDGDLDHSPYHLKGPVLAMEFIQTPEQLKTILGTVDPTHNHQEMLEAIHRDYFFIAAYALLYIALSLLLAHRHQRRWAVYLAWVAAICGISAALFDVRENIEIVNLLSGSTTNPQEIVSTIHLAATVKWVLSFITIAILALNFYASEGWLLVVGFAFRLTAVVGLIGLWYLPILMLAVGPLVPALLVLFILGLFRPQKFIEEL